MKELLRTLEITVVVFYMILALLLGAFLQWQSDNSFRAQQPEQHPMTLRKVSE